LAVDDRAISTSAASLWSPAMRVTARTCEYDNSPRANAAVINGNPLNA
jgi:hypothetical protein